MHVDALRVRSDEAMSAIGALLDRAAGADGRRPLSERKWIDLVEAGPEGLVTLTARSDTDLLGLAQVSGHPGAWGVEIVVDPRHRGGGEEVQAALLAAAVEAVATGGGGQLHLWVTSAGAIDDRIAAANGLHPGRELLQLRRPLPVHESYDLDVRPFVPGRDDAAWLEANNRAFAGHPEQGAWTAATLTARQKEPWFDPDGFLLHEQGGRLAGFCWTKVHRDHDPWLGEIYVIGVDPDFQGHGIGRPLVLAGLDALTGQGAAVAMLYVDGANRSVLRLYQDLGFEVHHVDRAYVGDIPSAHG